jgi:hypothetical protein
VLLLWRQAGRRRGRVAGRTLAALWQAGNRPTASRVFLYTRRRRTLTGLENWSRVLALSIGGCGGGPTEQTCCSGCGWNVAMLDDGLMDVYRPESPTKIISPTLYTPVLLLSPG